MTEQDVLRRLVELKETDPDGVRLLAAEIDAQCRGPARAVLDTWGNGAPDRDIPCAFVCSELKELAVDEMLRRADAVAPARRVLFMEMVVAQQGAFRELTLTVLEPLLKDKSPAGAELRTCEAAYLLIRRMVTLRGAEAAEFSSEGSFVALSPDQREREIRRWTNSAAWKAIFPNRR